MADRFETSKTSACQDVTVTAAVGAETRIWAAVDRLVDRAPNVEALVAHRLEPFAARRLRARGEPVPEKLARLERTSELYSVLVPVLMADIRRGCTGPLLVVKGPEAAARYPDPALRPYIDVDLLVADPVRVQRELLGAGFVETGDPLRYEGGPHERPLVGPSMPMSVEVHGRLNWPRWLEPPAVEELFEAALPASYGLDEVVVLPASHHAIVLAAHAWTHGPLASIRSVLDVAVMAEEADPRELDRLAKEWGVDRLWKTVRRVADALFDDGRPPWPLRVWARHLLPARERTVLEAHLARSLSGFSALAPPRALHALAWHLASDVRPFPGEGWGSKVRRMQRAFVNAAKPKTEHDVALDPTSEGGARLAPRRRDFRSADHARHDDDRDRNQEK